MNENRIEWASVREYNRHFPDAHCAVEEPGTKLVILTADGKMVACDFYEESDDTFRQRLERSIADKYNYFLDEWEEYIPECLKGCKY